MNINVDTTFFDIALKLLTTEEKKVVEDEKLILPLQQPKRRSFCEVM